MAEPTPLVDFSAGIPEQPAFRAIDDVVMGGCSCSSWSWSQDEGAALFSGEVSTRNNGGFASVRSLPWGGWSDVPNAQGLQLLVKGDGQRFKLNAKTSDEWDGITWQQDFSTSGQDWQQVDLPYSKFVPTLRGNVVASAPPLSGGAIRQLGFMISKLTDRGGSASGFTPGRFRLAVKWVRPLL